MTPLPWLKFVLAFCAYFESCYLKSNSGVHGIVEIPPAVPESDLDPATAVPSNLWDSYLKDVKSGKQSSSILPDFSYAGYKAGDAGIPENHNLAVYDVTDYGAMPDDFKDDQVGIQAAIYAACKTKQGGIIRFPPGTFHVFTDLKSSQVPIAVNCSKIILKGSGSTKDGTIIFHVLPQDDVPVIFARGSHNRKNTVQLTKHILRGESQIKVSSTAGFKANQFIVIEWHTNRQSAFEHFLDGKQLRAGWTKTAEGINGQEINKIKEVNGADILCLHEPLMTKLLKDWNVSISIIQPLQEIGIEDISFMGNWIGNLIHLRSPTDDGGWMSIKLDYVVNSWIRECNFINVNRAILVQFSLSTSVIHCRLLGNEGHFGFQNQYSSRHLTALSADLSRGSVHAVSISYQAEGTVFWRVEMRPEFGIDAHANQPFATLFDCIQGGYISEGGGDAEFFPNHLRDMVFWNFLNERSRTNLSPVYMNFWKEKDKERPFFVSPVFAGLHGRAAEMNPESVKAFESPGNIVSPISLYEAQLKLRIGKPPAWIEKAKRKWTTVRVQSFPDYFDPIEQDTKNAGNLKNFVMTFTVKNMMSYLKRQTLKRNELNPFKYSLAPENAHPHAKIKTDFVKLCQVVHNIVTYVYAFNGNKGDTVLFDPQLNATLRIDVKSKAKEPANFYQLSAAKTVKFAGQNFARDWDTALKIGNAIGATVEKQTSSGGTTISITVQRRLIDVS